MKYQVKTFREAGLHAKWAERRRPYIIVRKENNGPWYYVDGDMFERMKQVGIIQGFIDLHETGHSSIL